MFYPVIMIICMNDINLSYPMCYCQVQISIFAGNDTNMKIVLSFVDVFKSMG